MRNLHNVNVLLHVDRNVIRSLPLRELLSLRKHYEDLAYIKSAIKRLAYESGAYDTVKRAKRSQRACEQCLVRIDRELNRRIKRVV